MHCPSSDPHIASPKPLGGLGAAVVPARGTELGLDQVSVRVRVKKVLGCWLGLVVFGVRVSVRLRVGVRVRVRFMVRFRVRLTVGSLLALRSESVSGSVLG